MRKAIAILMCVAGWTVAQVTPPTGIPPTGLPPTTTQPQTPQPKQPGTGPEKPGTGRLAGSPRTAPAGLSYKELKYPPLRPVEIPRVETLTLANGMKVFLLEDHELPVVNGAARVRTGNLFDPADKVGLATLTGMVMRTGGTKTKTGEQLDVELENIAASVEAGIGESSGSVSFSTLKENTDLVLADFHDVMTAPEFRPEKIELARGQLRSSISRRNDDAAGISQREFTDIVYGKNTPYGWDVEYVTVDRIARADMQAFYKRYFFPANVMLAVWGDFNTAEMKGKLEKLFADWTVQQPAVPDFPKVSNAAAGGVYLAAKKDVTQTFFAMGHLGGEFRDKDYPALEILGDILGGGFQSRLFQQVRTKMGNAYDISAAWGANYDHPGLFEISGSTKAVSTVETIKAIEQEVARVRTAEVSEDELKTAKETALNSLVFAYDTRAKTLGRMLTYTYFGYPQDFIQQYQKALAAVTRADVLRVAKEHLDPARFTIVAVGNPDTFSQSLESLGKPVTPIDLKIAQPKQETTKADEANVEMGKQILARAQRAAGGVEKLTAVKDFYQVVEFQLVAAAGGLKVKETDRWIAPTYFRQESEVPAGRISAYFDGKTGWISTPQGYGPLAGAQQKQVQGDMFRLMFPLLLSDRTPGRTVVALDSNTLEISDSGGEVARIAFNETTGLPSRITYEAVHVTGPPLTVEDTFSDYRDVGGMKLPFQITIEQGGKTFADVTVVEAKVNSGLKLPDLEKR